MGNPLDNLIGIKKLVVNGVEQPTRQSWNFQGGAACVDNPALDRLDITLGDDVSYTALQRIAFAAVTDWYVSRSGTKTGTGTGSGDPILPEELSKRLDGLTLTVAGFMSVHYDAAGDPTGSLLITWNTPRGCQLVIDGVATATGVSGTLTTFHALVNSGGSQQSYGFTDSALPTAGAWTATDPGTGSIPLVGKRIRITSGARAGLCMTVAKDQNTNTTPVAKTARIATPYLSTFTFPYDDSKAVRTLPVVGDAYVVESIPRLGSVQTLGSFDPDATTSGLLLFRNIALAVGGVAPPVANSVTFVDSNPGFVEPGANGQYIIIGGSCDAIIANGGFISVIGCVINGAAVFEAGSSAVLQDSIIQGCQLEAETGSLVTIYDDGPDGVGIWDFGGFAALAKGGEIQCRAPLYGVNVGGLQLANGGRCPWVTIPPAFVATGGTVLLLEQVAFVSWAITTVSDRISGSAIYQSAVGGGLSQRTHEIRFTGSAAAIAEFPLCRLSGSGTIVAVYFVPDATSNPSVGSNSQTLNLGKRSGTTTGGSPTAVASFVLNNANSFGGCTQFENAAFGAISNGAFVDGNILTLSSTLVGTATVPNGVLIVVTQ